MSNFKEALLKAKSSSLPECIQNIVDKGLIQECETIDNTHYLMFAFMAKDITFFNYENGYFSNFITTITNDVIYVGGLSADNKGNILKCIIYPYYININNTRQTQLLNGDDNTLVSHIMGIPQIINKSNKLKVTDLFVCDTYFRTFNLVTNNSDVWSNFLKGTESYKNTFITQYENGNLCEPSENNDVTYYGVVTGEKDLKYKYTKKYGGLGFSKSLAIPISYVEDTLKNCSITTSIATQIYCNDKSNKSRIESANIHKKGMDNIADSVYAASMNIRAGASNIANALNKHPDCIHYA